MKKKPLLFITALSALVGCTSPAPVPFSARPEAGITPAMADTCNVCAETYCGQEWDYFQRYTGGDHPTIKDDPLLSMCLTAWCGETGCAEVLPAENIWWPLDWAVCDPAEPRSVVDGYNFCCDTAGVLRASFPEDGFSKWCPAQ